MWVMPSLSRPKQAAAVLGRIKKVGHSSPGIVFVNGETHAREYLVELAGNIPYGWKIIVNPENIGCIGALNWLLKEYLNEPWYGFIGDDEMLAEDAPSDWDQRLIAAAGDWKIAHGWENWNMGRRCQGYPVFGGKLVRAVGYLGLPTTRHNFGFDSHWEWLNGAPAFGGGGLHNMILVPEINITHNRADPEFPIDACYKLADSTMEDDRKAFWDWISKELKATAGRVRAAQEANTHMVYIEDPLTTKLKFWNDIMVASWQKR